MDIKKLALMISVVAGVLVSPCIQAGAVDGLVATLQRQVGTQLHDFVNTTLVSSSDLPTLQRVITGMGANITYLQTQANGGDLAAATAFGTIAGILGSGDITAILSVSGGAADLITSFMNASSLLEQATTATVSTTNVYIMQLYYDFCYVLGKLPVVAPPSAVPTAPAATSGPKGLKPGEKAAIVLSVVGAAAAATFLGYKFFYGKKGKKKGCGGVSTEVVLLSDASDPSSNDSELVQQAPAVLPASEPSTPQQPESAPVTQSAAPVVAAMPPQAASSVVVPATATDQSTHPQHAIPADQFEQIMKALAALAVQRSAEPVAGTEVVVHAPLPAKNIVPVDGVHKRKKVEKKVKTAHAIGAPSQRSQPLPLVAASSEGRHAQSAVRSDSPASVALITDGIDAGTAGETWEAMSVLDPDSGKEDFRGPVGIATQRTPRRAKLLQQGERSGRISTDGSDAESTDETDAESRPDSAISESSGERSARGKKRRRAADEKGPKAGSGGLWSMACRHPVISAIALVGGSAAAVLTSRGSMGEIGSLLKK